MHVINLEIENFRGIKRATIPFNGHTLLIGGNNIGKSTICEALDLVLGPERLSRNPVVQEHDFYQSKYLDEAGKPVVIRITAIIAGLTPEIERKFTFKFGFWNTVENKLLDGTLGPAETNDPIIKKVLVIDFIGNYNIEEDEFEGSTVSRFPLKTEGQPQDIFTKYDKRDCGFLFLRTLRTGARALSLEKGSLLDLILRLKDDDRTKMWEDTLLSLRNLNPAIHSIAQLSSILNEVTERMNMFIRLSDQENKLGFFPSDLTREHLRKVITFFASSEFDNTLVPFNRLGTGAINTFVFSLLTFIADLKGNVIFAMEEPEIALPPHTQRRIIQYVMGEMQQAIFTSHSPYVIEQFAPENVVLLKRTEPGVLNGIQLNVSDLKLRTYKGSLRQKIAEAILGKGVLLVEGITEENLFVGASEVIDKSTKNLSKYTPLDLCGVSIVGTDSDGNLAKYGKFFKNLGLKTYAFFDKQNKSQPILDDLYNSFDSYWELDKNTIELYLKEEIPLEIQIKFINEARNRADFPEAITFPDDWEQEESKVKSLLVNILKGRKGYGYAQHLIHMCSPEQLPEKIIACLMKINEDLGIKKVEKESTEEK